MKSGKTTLKNKKDEEVQMIRKQLIIKNYYKKDVNTWTEKIGIKNNRSPEIFKEVRGIMEDAEDMHKGIIKIIQKYDNEELITALFIVGAETVKAYNNYDSLARLLITTRALGDLFKPIIDEKK